MSSSHSNTNSKPHKASRPPSAPSATWTNQWRESSASVSEVPLYSGSLTETSGVDRLEPLTGVKIEEVEPAADHPQNEDASHGTTTGSETHGHTYGTSHAHAHGHILHRLSINRLPPTPRAIVDYGSLIFLGGVYGYALYALSDEAAHSGD